MAILQLEKHKYFSDSNMRKIISTLVGLMSSVSALEDQCIKEYDETKTYQKGQIVVGSDGYFYEAVTVTNGVFDSSKWTKIGNDNFEELDVDTIKGFLGLTQEQLETMADLISTEIRLDKVFSSSDTYTRIDNALKEAKEYCLTQLAKKSTGSFKKATSTAEVTDGNYLYLILNSVTSKYDIYALVDSNVELLTSVDVNLDNYFTKADLEADYLKKVDADGKYATISTVDGKVDKDKIVTVLNDTVTDEQVVSAKAVYDGLNTKANDSEVVKKTDISTSIDSASTNDTVPSAKAVNTLLNNKANKMVINPSQNVDDLVDEGSYYVVEVRNAPREYGWIDVLAYTDYTIQLFYPTLTGNCEMYIRRRQAGVWESWKKVCTTTVADVSMTKITSFDTTSVTGTISYEVKNGICYVSISHLANTSTGVKFPLISNILPKPKELTVTTCVQDTTGVVTSMAYIELSGVLFAHFYVANKGGYASFSYPVAE